MTNQLAIPEQSQLSGPENPAIIMERVIIEGDLAGLRPEERVTYYMQVCGSLRLNPLTRPFEYIRMDGKLILYALKNCSDQLRNLYSISIEVVERTISNGMAIVRARATTPDGRVDEDVGMVWVGNQKGKDLANSLMKCTTKAKRRVTLSICGLSMLDESEVDGPRASVDHNTGRLLSASPDYEQKARDLVNELKTIIDDLQNGGAPDEAEQRYLALCRRFDWQWGGAIGPESTARTAINRAAKVLKQGGCSDYVFEGIDILIHTPGLGTAEDDEPDPETGELSPDQEREVFGDG